MLEQRLQQQFFECADLYYQAAEALSKPLADAVAALLGAITTGGKVVVAGTSGAAALAPYVAARMVAGFERERPGLAALAVPLASPGATPEAMVQALGLPGDLLLLIDGGGDDALAPALTAAAQGKDMTVLALTAANADWVDMLTDTDLRLAMPGDRRARVLELQLLSLHAMLDALDLQLLGEQDPS